MRDNVSAPVDVDAPAALPLRRDPDRPFAPPPELARHAAAGPLTRLAFPDGHVGWLVTGYELARAVLTDPRFSARPDLRHSALPRPDMSPTGAPGEPAPGWFPDMDAPAHTRYRRLLAGHFTVRRMRRLEPRIAGIVDDRLAAVAAAGPPADLVTAFALPVPSLVICLLLGVPYEKHEFFQQNSTKGLDARSTDEEKAASIGAMFDFMWELAALKEREPGDDLMSRLITEYVARDELSRETAVMNCVILLQAGHETTASMISLGTVALLQHPDVLERLRRTEDPALVANVVEELMRYLTIVHTQVDRVALEDLTINGQLIRAGDHVLMNLPAGNWDSAFVDHPDTLDIDRNPRGHLGFGFGVHQCIGQNLARVELQVALSTLVRRLPALRLAVPQEKLSFAGEQEIYTIHELPVTW
jgi:cytochrome P450